MYQGIYRINTFIVSMCNYIKYYIYVAVDYQLPSITKGTRNTKQQTTKTIDGDDNQWYQFYGQDFLLTVVQILTHVQYYNTKLHGD